MSGIPRPSPALVVAMIALVVAIGGTAFALPGRYTVGRDDLKNSSVGARALGRMIVAERMGVRSEDPTANDGVFTEMTGRIKCPDRAPLAIDPSIGGMGPRVYEVRRTATTNRFGSPDGYVFSVLGDEGPDPIYTMTVNCVLAR